MNAPLFANRVRVLAVRYVRVHVCAVCVRTTCLHASSSDYQDSSHHSTSTQHPLSRGPPSGTTHRDLVAMALCS